MHCASSSRPSRSRSQPGSGSDSRHRDTASWGVDVKGQLRSRVEHLLGVSDEEFTLGNWMARLSAEIRVGWTRVKGAAAPNTLTALAATLSWVICFYLLHQPTPVFAPIATFLCLGFSRNREPRKVLEVGLGATFGVLIGEWFGNAFGFGWWQVLVLMLVTPLIGRLIDAADLLTFQLAINAMVVGSMILAGSAATSTPQTRWLDALVGVMVAFLVSLVLPGNILTRPRRYVASALHESAKVLLSLSHAMAAADLQPVREAFSRLTVLRSELVEGRKALDSAMQVASVNPTFTRDRATLAELDRLLQLAGRMQTSVFMLGRQTRGMLIETGAQPEVAASCADLSHAVRSIADDVTRWRKPEEGRGLALRIAARLAPLELSQGEDWRTAALVSLMRAVAVDVLQLTGLSMEQARAALANADATKPRASNVELMPEEKASGVWGTSSFPSYQQETDRPDDSPETTDD